MKTERIDVTVLGSVSWRRSLHGCPLATCDRMSLWLSDHLEAVRNRTATDRLFRIVWLGGRGLGDQ